MHYFKYYLNCFIGFVEIPIDDEAADDASGQGPTAPTAPPTAATASLRALNRRWPLWNARRHQQLHPDSRRGGPDSRRGGPDSRRGARGGHDPRRSPPAIKHELATDSAPQRLEPRPPTPPPAYVEF